MKDIRKKDIVFRATGTFGTPGVARTVGTYDVLTNGTVRWAVHSVDGGSAPLVDYRINGQDIVDGKRGAKGVLYVSGTQAIVLRDDVRVEQFLEAVRSVI